MSDEPQTEQEWADYYQAHKDAPALWGEEVQGMKRQRDTLSVTVAVRFAPKAASRLRAYSKKWGVGYSEILRSAVAEFLAPPEPAPPPTIPSQKFPFTYNASADAAQTFTFDFSQEA